LPAGGGGGAGVADHVANAGLRLDRCVEVLVVGPGGGGVAHLVQEDAVDAGIEGIGGVDVGLDGRCRPSSVGRVYVGDDVLAPRVAVIDDALVVRNRGRAGSAVGVHHDRRGAARHVEASHIRYQELELDHQSG